MEYRPYQVHGRLNGRCGSAKRIWVLADPHFLAPSLFRRDARAFQEAMASGNGTAPEVMPEVLEAFFGAAENERPDVILLPGDLTFNGELAGLEYLAGRLSALRKTGIRILAVPGNHDINYPRAADLSGDIRAAAEPVSPDDWQRLIGPFGYDSGISHAPDSFSWIVPLTEDIRILGFDANTAACPGGITDDTLVWAREQLDKAKAEQAAVITVTHQNVLCQNPNMNRGFVLHNADDLIGLLKEYDVRLNLSGHVHLQHCSHLGSLTDIASESAAGSPLGMAELEIEAGHQSWSYRRRYFRCGQDIARQRMKETTDRFISTTLENLRLTQTERRQMEAACVNACTAMFGGYACTMETEDEQNGLRLWNERAAESFWGSNIISIANQEHRKGLI